MITRLTAVIFYAIALLAAPAVALAATLHVPVEFASIQSAVDAASAGDTVLVGPGSYRENIDVKKPLHLSSTTGAEATVVEAANPTLPVFIVSSADGTTLSGFTATGSKVAGLTVRGVKGARISHNTFTANANGVMVYTTTGAVIEENTASYNALYGIYLEASSNNTVTGNTANGNKDRGIFLTYSHNNGIIANKANMNAWNGITLWESNYNTIQDNLTLRNTYGVVIGNSTGNVQSGNTTIPNIYIILPILLIYLGILTYLAQKNILIYIYGK